MSSSWVLRLGLRGLSGWTRCVVYCVQLIQSKFSEFQLGIEAGSKRFERVDKMCGVLCAADPEQVQ